MAVADAGKRAGSSGSSWLHVRGAVVRRCGRSDDFASGTHLDSSQDGLAGLSESVRAGQRTAVAYLDRRGKYRIRLESDFSEIRLPCPQTTGHPDQCRFQSDGKKLDRSGGRGAKGYATRFLSYSTGRRGDWSRDT